MDKKEVIIKTNVCKSIIDQILNIDNILRSMNLPYKVSIDIDENMVKGINKEVIKNIHAR